MIRILLAAGALVLAWCAMRMESPSPHPRPKRGEGRNPGFGRWRGPCGTIVRLYQLREGSTWLCGVDCPDSETLHGHTAPTDQIAHMLEISGFVFLGS